MARPFEIIATGVNDRRSTMAREVRAGLAHAPRSIPPKYFYDEQGCRLFDAICDLPEYYLTRAEHTLLARHAAAIIDASRAEALCEIGSGMARKTGLLVAALCDRARCPLYVPFDIAPEALEQSARALTAAHPRLRVRGVVGDFARDLSPMSRASRDGGARLFAFLGSTIGNLDEREAPDLVAAIAATMTTDDAFLLGVDLVKDERALIAAYDDAAGVTATFNRNVLRVVSRDLDGDFDPDAFDHLALWRRDLERIEMHLVARRAQTATLRAIDLRVELAAGERVLTEISRKFTRESVERTLSQGRMRLVEWFADDGAFALCLARRA